MLIYFRNFLCSKMDIYDIIFLISVDKSEFHELILEIEKSCKLKQIVYM